MTLKEFKFKTQTGFTRQELTNGIEVEGMRFYIERDRNPKYFTIIGNGRTIATRARIDTVYNLVLQEIKQREVTT